MRFNRTVLTAFLTFGPWVGLAYAQQTAPAGVVTIATRATLGNSEVSVGSTVFSGDLLKTGEDGRLSVQSGTVQFTLGPNSSARIFRNLNRVIAELERGTLAYASQGKNEDLAVFALDMRVVPKTSVAAAGQIDIASRCDVIVSAIHSSVEVTSGRETKTIEETKSFRASSEFGVDYRDSWQPVLADYPDFPKDAQYHQSHAHVACPAGAWQSAKSPVAAGSSHFREIALGIAGMVTIPVVREAFESPDRP